MKLFKSLLVAPATLGLLAPMTATANELNLKDVSGYSSSEEVQSISEFNPAEELAVTNSRVDGLEARFNNFEAGGFSETTTASVLSKAMGFDAGTSLNVDGVSYTFPVGGATMVVGDATDISTTFTGACVYSAFTDYTPDDCGTGNSLGVTGKAVTASISYAFDNGFSVAGGFSSPEDEILGDSADIYGLNAAYSADNYGVALGYATDDGGAGADTTTWGFQGYYTFDLASLSVGYETQESGGTDSDGYFVGLTFPEVGAGSVNVAAATTGLVAEGKDEKMIYEASYSYPVNDSMTITPGVFIVEDTTDDTGVAVKASFSF